MNMTDKRKNKLKDFIISQIDERIKGLKSVNDSQSFIGYSPIEKIRGSLFVWVAVPFNGDEIFCQLRCPNETQIEQCGDITNITQELKDENKNIEYDDIIKIRNHQEALCKITFNTPTFDQISKMIELNDYVLMDKKKEFERIKKQYEDNKDKMSEVEKEVIEAQMKCLELQIGFILPDDTMAFVTSWAMGNDVTDIKKINKESFLKAAALARVHKKAPSDYISGVFTDFNKKEIDTYAFLVLEEHIKEHKEVEKASHRWFFGGKTRTLTA